jgi:hypothetical protein
MMTARERKPKSKACLGGHWDMTRRIARALGPFYLRLCLFYRFSRKIR